MRDVMYGKLRRQQPRDDNSDDDVEKYNII